MTRPDTRSLAGRLISGATQLTVSNGLVRLLSIITMPVLTGLLSPHAYGIASLVGTVVALSSMIAIAGIDMSYARAYHAAESPNGWTVEHFCWRFALVTGTLVAGIAGLASHLVGSGALEGWLPLLVGAGVLLSVVHTMAQSRAQVRARYPALSAATLIAGLVSVAISIAIARWWRQDATGLLLAMLAGYFVPIVVLGVPSLRALFPRSALESKGGRGIVSIGLAGVVTAPLYWVLSCSDRWFLQHFSGIDAVGIYSIGCSVAVVGMMVNSAVTSVWLPEAAREHERDPVQAQRTLGRLVSRLIAVMALVWLAVTAAGGDIVRLLADQRYHSAGDYVPYIAGGVFFYGVLHLGNAGLLLAKKLRIALGWWLAGGIMCLVLNLILVPRWGGVGAAITQAVCFAFIGLGIFGSAWRLARFRVEGWRLAILLAASVAAGIAMAPAWREAPLASLGVKLPLGIALAAFATWLMMPGWCAARINHLRRVALP